MEILCEAARVRDEESHDPDKSVTQPIKLAPTNPYLRITLGTEIKTFPIRPGLAYLGPLDRERHRDQRSDHLAAPRQPRIFPQRRLPHRPRLDQRHLRRGSADQGTMARRAGQPAIRRRPLPLHRRAQASARNKAGSPAGSKNLSFRCSQNSSRLQLWKAPKANNGGQSSFTQSMAGFRKRFLRSRQPPAS